MRILITGGSGFIGAHLVRHVHARWPQAALCNLDALTYAADPRANEHLVGTGQLRFVHGDICERQAVDRAFEGGVDLLFHLAAESHVDNSLADGQPFLRTNVLGTQVLLEAARDHGVQHFIQVSTDEVYGDLSPEQAPLREDAPLRPSNPYSASKAAADLLALSHARSFGVPVSITRCTNNLGPGQHAEKLIPTLVRHALGDQDLPLYGDGLQVRDWISVHDHCRALIHVAELSPGGTWNVGARNERRNRDIAAAVLRHLDKPADRIASVRDRPGHDVRYALDPAALEATGWRAQDSLDTALTQTIDALAAVFPLWSAIDGDTPPSN